MNQTIAIVDASVGETPAERNLTRSLDATTRVYKVSDGQVPPAPAGDDWRYDGVVISGSQTSVYDDLDWIHALTSWVREVHRADIPTLPRVAARRSISDSVLTACIDARTADGWGNDRTTMPSLARRSTVFLGSLTSTVTSPDSGVAGLSRRSLGRSARNR